MQPPFLQIDLEWRELLVKYPNTGLEIIFGNTLYFAIPLSSLEYSSLKYFKYYKSIFQKRYLDTDFRSQDEFFRNGPNEIDIKHEDCIFISYGLIDQRIRYEVYQNIIKTDIVIPSESRISWTEFYEKIKRGDFNFGNRLETFDLIIYLIGRVKYAVYLYELKTKEEHTNKTNSERSKFPEIQKSFPEYLLHDSRDKLANKLKEEFKTDIGKNIRLMIEALQNNNPQLINIEARQRKAIYRAIKDYFNRNIGTYQSIISPKLLDLESNPDYNSIKGRLDFILKQL